MKAPEEFLNVISTQLNEFLQNGKQTSEDIRKNVLALVQSQLSKLDVVSREEFEVQQEILAKTRSQLEQLQSQLAQLEEKILPPKP